MSATEDSAPGGRLADFAPQRNCEYCGAELNPQLYFCTRCATPYMDAERLLPRLRPVPLTEGMLIAKKAPHVATLFWTYFAVIFGSSFLGVFLFGWQRDDLIFLTAEFAIFITTCVFASLHWSSLAVQLKRPGFPQKEALLALLALVPLIAVNYYYHGWLTEMMNESLAEEITLTEQLRALGIGEAGVIFLFCVFPAVTEEIAFRGLIQHWLSVAIRPSRALLLASVLFAAMHFSILSLPYLFAVGVVLGWAKWKTGSLYPSMLIHFLHNLIVLEFFQFG